MLKIIEKFSFLCLQNTLLLLYNNIESLFNYKNRNEITLGKKKGKCKKK
jgi:hypothetical protein